MAFLTRTADLLQDALEGRGDVDPRVSDLVPTAQALASISVVVAPAPDFVSTLGLRLQAEAAALAQAGPTSGARPRTESRKPVVVLVGRGLPRLLAGVAATVIAVGGVVGVAARSALPGQALYPVKQALDTAAVGLAGSDLDKGMTLLLQSEDRVHEASQLSDDPTAAAVDIAMHGAIDGITRAQQLLLPSDGSAPDPRALLVLQEFSARTMPRVEALRARVPAGSLPLLSTLQGLLNGLSTNVVQLLAGCTTCGPAGAAARASLSPSVGAGASPSTLPDLSATASAGPSTGVRATREPTNSTAGTAGTAGTRGRETSVGTGAPVPPGVAATVSATRGGGAGGGAPTVTGGGAGVGASATLPGATATGGLPGATATGGLPGASATGGLPGATATGGLPGATVTTGGAGVGGGVGATVPGATATVPVPGVPAGGVGVGSGPVVSRTCVLGVCR